MVRVAYCLAKSVLCNCCRQSCAACESVTLLYSFFFHNLYFNVNCEGRIFIVFQVSSPKMLVQQWVLCKFSMILTSDFFDYFLWLCTVSNVVILIVTFVSYHSKYPVNKFVSYSINYAHFIFSFCNLSFKIGFHFRIVLNGRQSTEMQ